MLRSPNAGGTVRDFGIGGAIDYRASRVMDRTTGRYFERQSAASRRREEEVGRRRLGAVRP